MRETAESSDCYNQGPITQTTTNVAF